MDNPFDAFDDADENVDAHFEGAGQQYNVDPDLLRVQANVESSGNPNAVSPQGAEGYSQIMPDTQRHLGVGNPWSRRQSIYGQAKYMREMADHFGGMDLAVAAYHGGPDTSQWGPRTRDYQDKIAAGYARRKRTPPAAPGPNPFDEFDQPPAAAANPFDEFDGTVPEVGLPLTKRQSLIQLPKAQEGAGEPGGDPRLMPRAPGYIDAEQAATPRQPAEQTWLDRDVKARRDALGRIGAGIARGWEETPPILTDEAQRIADKWGLGSDARAVGWILKGLGAAWQGTLSTAYEIGESVYPGLGREIAGMGEAFPLAGHELGVHLGPGKPPLAVGQPGRMAPPVRPVEPAPPAAAEAPQPTPGTPPRAPESTPAPAPFLSPEQAAMAEQDMPTVDVRAPRPPPESTAPIDSTPVTPAEDLAAIAAGKPPSGQAMPALEQLAEDARHPEAAPEPPAQPEVPRETPEAQPEAPKIPDNPPITRKPPAAAANPFDEFDPPKAARPPTEGATSLDAPGWKEIGRNFLGQTVYEDARGARSIGENGVRRTEPVGMAPTREGLRVSIPQPADKPALYQVAIWNPTISSTTGRPVFPPRTPEWGYGAATEGVKPTPEVSPPAESTRPRDMTHLNLPQTIQVVREMIGRGETPTADEIAFRTGTSRDYVEKLVMSEAVKPEGASPAAQAVKAASDQFAAQQAAKPPKAPPARPADYGATNTVFTADAAAAARERLRARFSQINTGFDPALMLDGFTLAGYHVEAGTRSFAAYAKAMIDDLGEGARPFLKQWYNAVADHPGLDTHGMSDRAEIEMELQRLNKEHTLPAEAADGVQEPVRVRDEGTSPGDVHPADQGGTDGRPPAGEVRGGPRAPGADAGPGSEEPTRPGEPGGRAGGRGEGAGDADRVPGAGAEPGAAGRPDATVQGQNHTIQPGSLGEERGPAAKARGNLEAIELAKRLIREDRLATKAEQEVLARYVGWGGLKGAFDVDGQFGGGLEATGKRLKQLLTKDEYQTAARSTQYAHYTAERVVRAMWDAVRGMGFKAGSVFEPGMGVGHFLGMMPADLAAKSHYQGIEMDRLTASIAKLLYPESGVRRADFIRTPVPEGHFDLAIGNPPFSDVVIQADPKYAARGFMLHDYFFAKSMDSVRPGGILGFITSAGTMNKMDPKARLYLAERAEFLGGVRLPNDTFTQNAGTKVTTDILFFQRRPEGQVALTEHPAWTETVGRTLRDAKGNTHEVNVSRYFSEHPEQVLGEEGMFDQLVAGPRYAVRPVPGVDFETAMRVALDRLPKDVVTEPLTPGQRAALDFNSGQVKDGSFYLGPKGELRQYNAGAGRDVPRRGQAGEGSGFTTGEIERIQRLIPIRDSLRDVFAADLTRDDMRGTEARARLNKHYDAFVRKFGPINKAEFQHRRPTLIQQETARLEAREEARSIGSRFDDGDFDPTDYLRNKANVTTIARAREQAREAARQAGRRFDEGEFDPADMPDVTLERRPNIKAFMSDPESYRLRSIERYNDATGAASKRDIFERNILADRPEPEIKSANDGVLWSLNEHGRLDLDAMAAKMGRERSEIIGELGDSIYRQPGTRDTYQTKDEYLSGDVVTKLEQARAAAERDPEMRRNVAALEAAVPPPLSPAQISMVLGMPWIPREVTERFAAEHLELGPTKTAHNVGTGTWMVRAPEADRHAGAAKWGTARRSAQELLSDAMNRTPPRIYDPPDREGRRAFDAVATQAAQDKVEAIKQAFRDWVDADVALGDKLAGMYNDKLNRTVLRVYDGSYLTTPGVADDWHWRPHQTRVVARIVQAGNTYMAHAVGAGKTSAMIGSGMEMRRLGLVKKPMYVVPNHMLGQFTKEFYEQYPTARIAVADEQRFHTGNRRQFMANVAQEDFDAVIITNSSFGKIPVSEDFQAHLIQEQIDMLDEAISAMRAEGAENFTIRRVQNQKEKLEQKLSARASSTQDQTMTFEEMGVDFLFVDEAHQFRKLSFGTKQGGLKGIDPEGSGMAWDLYAKVRYLDSQRPGRSVVFASGTPVTNTMAELYSLSRYMQPEALQERNIAHFDSWAQTFGDTKTQLEETPAGNYAPVTRFNQFVNMPELYKMVGGIMDIVTPTQLEQYVTRPQLAGGARLQHMAPRTPFLDAYQASLGQRMEAIKNRRGRPTPGDDIMLSVINDGRHSAIDPRYAADMPSEPTSKLNLMVQNVARIWRETGDTEFFSPADGYKTSLGRGPATQIVFANLGVNGRGPIGFSGYSWMKEALRREGIPPSQIAFIGDYKTPMQRQSLFNDMNEGKVRVLIGSTQKMGTGINVQKRLVALHNEDPLWFPADDEQRVGRILRQGNTNPEIQVHDYTTKGTYDSVMWGLMAKKARFIEQFFRGDPELRVMEDLGEASMYEQASAMSTTDERMITLTELRQSLDKARRREQAHASEQYSLRNRIQYLEEFAQRAARSAEDTRQDIAQRTDTRGDAFAMTVAGQRFTKRADALAALVKVVDERKVEMAKGASRTIGEIGGFPFEITRDNYTGDGIYISYSLKLNGINREMPLTSGDPIASAESRLRGLDDDLAYTEKKRADALTEATAARPSVGKPYGAPDEVPRLAKAVADLEEEMRPKTPEELAKQAETRANAEAILKGEPTRGFGVQQFRGEPALQAGFPGDAQFSRRVPLHSAVARAVDGLKQAKGTGEQMLATLTKVPGVKPEEVRWLGLEPWLRGQKSVTREQIADYVRANALDVREVTKGHGTDAQYAAKFERYTLPGGENYRELLITLPVDTAADFNAKAARIAELDERLRDINRRKMSVNTADELADLERQARNTMTQMEMMRSEKNLRGAYQSGHWDEPNVLAHIRFNEREVDGKRVLLVEEVQSDWHQQGRKQGYREAEPTDPMEQRPDQSRRVPDAPFKTTWPALTMKRIIKYAADNGFDRVAWAPGEVHVARYDLSKQISHVEFRDSNSGGIGRPDMKAPDGFGTLHAYDLTGKEVIAKYVEPSDLPDLIGKEIADRLMAATPTEGRSAGMGHRVRQLSGLDLQVGGEGMAGFYDRMLPAEVNKIVAKYGAKVSKSEINTQENASAAFRALSAKPAMQPVHSLDLTPALKHGVQTEGLPLFREGAAGAGELPAREAVQAAADAVHDMLGGKGRVEVLSGDNGFQVHLPDGTAFPVDGYTAGRLIRVALTPDATFKALNHEALHALRNMGVFTKGEWATLERTAAREKWGERYGTAEINRDADLSPAMHIEEAIAERLADALTNPKAAPLFLQRMADKVRQFFARLRNALEGNGFRTADDVFGAVERGEVGARELGSGMEQRGPPDIAASKQATDWLHEVQFARRPRSKRGMIPPPVPEYLADKKGVFKAAAEVKAAFAPTSLGGAKPMEHMARQHGSELAQSSAKSAYAMEKVRDAVDRLKPADQEEMFHRMETGQPQLIPALQPIADALRQEITTWTAKVQSLGKGVLENAIENYMGHVWSNYREWSNKPAGTPPAAAVVAGAGHAPLLGSKAFLKKRFFPTQREGIEAGLIPVTTNPIDLQLIKLREMARFYHGQRLADQMINANIAQWVPAAKSFEAKQKGLVLLDDRVFQPRIMGGTRQGVGGNMPPAAFGILEPGNWYAPEPMARIFNRYMSRGLYGKSIWYDAMRVAGNAMNSLQLGLSGFHATFVTMDTMISRVALGAQQLGEGKIGKGAASILQGVTPYSVVKSVREGAKLRKAWLDPDQATPEWRRLAQDLNLGGGRINMDQFYRNTVAGPFFRHFKDLANPMSVYHQAAQMVRDAKSLPEKIVMVPLRLAGRVLDQIQEPLMGHMVPRAKLGVFADLARNWNESHPTATPAERSAAMTKFWDSVDNRLGQMVYDDVFWHKATKDIAFIAVRSVGWNLGTIRELAGGAVDTGALLNDLAHGRRPEFTTRMAYTMAMPVVVALYGAILTYIATGKPPQQLMDYYFPPSGVNDDDGNPQRRIIPSYIKDVIEYWHDPVQTVLNKTHPLIAAAKGLLQNQDYYGGIIYNPETDYRIPAYLDYLINQAVPFSWRGYERMKEQGQPMLDQMLSFWGIQPAPKSIADPERAEAWQTRHNRQAYRKREREQGRMHIFTPRPE